MHNRSRVGVGGLASYSRAVQTVNAAHSWSVVAVGGTDKYSSAEHSAVHSRSEFAVGATDSYSAAEHTVSAVHARSAAD